MRGIIGGKRQRVVVWHSEAGVKDNRTALFWRVIAMRTKDTPPKLRRRGIEGGIHPLV
jgi:hypothetical protein